MALFPKLDDVPFVEAVVKGRKQRPSLIALDPSFTSSDPGAAYAVAMTMHKPSARESVHYMVDAGTTLRLLSDHISATPNVGSMSPKTLTIRICDDPRGAVNRWYEDEHSELLFRLSDLVAQLCIKYHIRPQMISETEYSRWLKWRIKRRGGIWITHPMNAVPFPEKYFMSLLKANIEKHRLSN